MLFRSMSDEEMVKAFSKFIAFRREAADTFVRDRLLRHDNYSIPESFHGSKSVVFSSMADDFTRGLIGELNRFLIGINHAECWVRVVNEYPKPERLGLLWEFADPLLELSVGRSYSVRNQFIFAVTQLAHQTNMRARPRWPDKLCADDAIGFKTLEIGRASCRERV